MRMLKRIASSRRRGTRNDDGSVRMVNKIASPDDAGIAMTVDEIQFGNKARNPELKTQEKQQL